MATHTQKKNKTHSLLDERRTPQANGGMHASPRCDPGEHVLPIIQRLRWYAQLATRLANPRRYVYIFSEIYPILRDNISLWSSGISLYVCNVQ
jgi:hypothetical protein